MKIKKAIILIIFLITLISTFTSTNAQTYNLELSYNNGNINLLSLNIIIQDLKEETYGNYTSEIISFEDKSLYRNSFGIPLTFIFDIADPETGEITGGGVVSLNYTNFTLYLPYYENAKEIKIYDFYGVELLTIPVSQFSKDLCGDGTCQFYEDMKSCPADCVAVKEEVKIEEKPLTEKIAFYVEENKTIFVISAILLVILIILIILLLKSKPKENK